MTLKGYTHDSLQKWYNDSVRDRSALYASDLDLEASFLLDEEDEDEEYEPFEVKDDMKRFEKFGPGKDLSRIDNKDIATCLEGSWISINNKRQEEQRVEKANHFSKSQSNNDPKVIDRSSYKIDESFSRILSRKIQPANYPELENDLEDEEEDSNDYIYYQEPEIKYLLTTPNTDSLSSSRVSTAKSGISSSTFAIRLVGSSILVIGVYLGVICFYGNKKKR